MTPTELERKLTAIFYADVAGYSRLTGQDEAGTHRILSGYLDLITEEIERHGGRVVHFAGDAVLADFASILAAFETAVSIQRELRDRNREFTDENRLEFRIGLNLGEVIVDRNDIYGDGVNVAARLESLADPGGICVSERVFEQIEGTVDAGFDDMGAQSVKNIARPIRCYRVLLDGAVAPSRSGLGAWITPKKVAAAVLAVIIVAGLAWWESRPHMEPASADRMALPLPDKPSIAVLPFVNLGGGTKDDYFVDGMTDDLITDLSKVSGLFVIARNSVFTYKGRAMKVQKVAEDLGVRYVLEGSVRKAAGQVRINAQLIDALSGTHVWAERYDRPLDDIFMLQDEVIGEIVRALAIELSPGERASTVAAEAAPNMEAYEFLLHGLELRSRFNWQDFLEAREMFRKALEHDEDYARARTELGNHHYEAWRIWGENREKNLRQTIAFAERAVELNPRSARPYVLLALAHKFRGEHDVAERAARRALDLGPTDATSLAGLADYLRLSGNPEQAIALMRQAMRHDPYFPAFYLAWLGHAYFMVGQYEDATVTLRRGIERDATYVPFHLFLAATYAVIGKVDDAKRAAAQVLELVPGFTLSGYAGFIGHRHQLDLDRDLTALRKAGLPE
jgi:adenylate cyclase